MAFGREIVTLAGLRLESAAPQGHGMNGRTPYRAFIDGLPSQQERRMTDPETDDMMAA